MRHRGLAAGLLAFVLAAGLAAAPAAGQARDDYDVPRTPWGDPDLQGLWDTRTYTPVERPPEFGDREFMTVEEAAERERLGLRRIVSDDDDDLLAAELVEQDVQRYARSDRPDDGRPGFRIQGAEYNAFWSADPTSPRLSLRTSQIIEPRDGQMPSLTREALLTWERREAERRERTQADDWEDRGLSERCLTRNGLPGEMLGSSQQPVKEIVQTPGYVSIVMPYGYVRIIPVNDPTPIGADIRQWNGYSRGRWEGDTLVVETANFKNTVANVAPAHGGPFGGSAHVHYYLGTGETLRLTERFTRIDDETLEYRYTVEDPAVFVRPWSADQLLHARFVEPGGLSGPHLRVRLPRAQLRDDQRHPRRARGPRMGARRGVARGGRPRGRAGGEVGAVPGLGGREPGGPLRRVGGRAANEVAPCPGCDPDTLRP